MPAATAEKVRPPAKHPVDEVLPPQQLAIYGFQHVLAFYAGAVIVPILLGSAIGLTPDQLIHLINADLFTCGIASLLQAIGFWKIGVRLPLLQGVTFTAVSPMIIIGVNAGGGVNGLLTIYGAVLVSGVVTFLLAPFFGKIVRFFPPVVTGTVITVIGFSLLPVAAGDAILRWDPKTSSYSQSVLSTDAHGNWHLASGGWKILCLALGTVVIIVVIQRLFRGFVQTIAVLLGLVIGTLIAWLAGEAHFDSVRTASWVGVTTPFHFGMPKFVLAAIISMVLVMLVTMVETCGDVFATAEIVGKRVDGEDVARALRADGVATFIGGIFNSFPYTCFAENVGLVRLTKIKSRYVVATAAVFMIILGLLPKAGAIVAGIPSSVLGGAGLAMFSTVAVVGIQTLGKVDFNDHRNGIIVATSLGLAMLVTAEPGVSTLLPKDYQVFLGSGITIGSITAFVLYMVFFHVGNSRGAAIATTSSGDVIGLAQINAMPKEDFVHTFEPLFQGNTWIIADAFDRRPFKDTQDLRESFQEALFSASDEKQRELIAGYPDLGSQEIAPGELGDASIRDRAAIMLSQLRDGEREELAGVTSAYREKFGFPLVICVRDAGSVDQLVAQGRARLDNSRHQELVTALVESAKIAGHRFDDLIADADPIGTARASMANPQ
ncbi:2-oxo-4-hydroxy-4-carboxy-5-ureidoimidazoline decarboxylase [Flexivirga caeni]|uniref:2-oxo-4-hydroxy-4-carboxy-5-ureidoimidazoline decarboxylase n=1 Tax=Flexivirga caeni TaxID=2294115 RepID=A0A3M9MIE7_9MICO|nr:2-oxo-4-hydroxy-4-carboxy-5-ureidoimidazoline decarboxylase [Flexivirga caeni]RNI24438.1 2-oxo-4-hydroxy-4-carboxy-5-ureidoimidazoline decarboxylase [Flexivirga caeni]